MTTLSVPIDVLTVAELRRIHAQLVSRYLKSGGGSIAVNAINAIRRELKNRESRR